MAGIKVAPRGHSHVFGSRAAARNALVYAGTSRKVYHVVVEGKGSALAVALDHKLRELFVLLKNYRQVVLGQLSGVSGRANYRLHAELGKAEVKHDLNVLKKIGVGMRKCTPHIIVFAAARRDQLLKLGNDPVPASVSGIIHSEAVVNLAPAVKTQHHIAHLAVGKVNNVVVNKHSVCRQRKTEVLARLFFNAARIGDKTLYHVEVHQRLAAEKVDLKIAPFARIGYKKIQSLLSHLKAHHRALAVVFSLTGKAVRAV